MENQHRHIKGYRDLTQQEIDLMNRIKAHGEATAKLLDEIHAHVSAQVVEAANEDKAGRTEITDRLDLAQPQRWIAAARTDLQVGIMKLVRAVAQPITF